MSEHSYTAQEALEVLLAKLRARDESLAAHVQAAIDVGKDVSDTEPATDKRKKARVYRKAVAFTHEEALDVALDVLQAYFVEQPLFVDATADMFATAALGVPTLPRRGSQVRNDERDTVTMEAQGAEKRIEIELQTEIQILKTGDETLPLRRTDRSLIAEQRRNIGELRALTDFARN